MARLHEVGGKPANKSERIVVRDLCSGLPAEWLVVPNIEILGSGRYRECDAIVIAPHAAFVIETKAWHGRLELRGRDWVHNGRTIASPMLATNLKAKVLKAQLRRSDPRLNAVWVQAAVVLYGHPEVNAVADERFVFRSTKDVVAFMLEQNSERSRSQPLDPEFIASAEQSLLLEARPVAPKRFGEYEVVDTVTESEAGLTFRAHHRAQPIGRSVLLDVIHLSPYAASPTEIEEQERLLSNEFRALEMMRGHPNIHGARDVFEDDKGNLIIVTDEVDAVDLSAMQLRGDVKLDEVRHSIARDVTAAVAHAHQAGVLHRQIDPRSILIRPDGVALLTNFAFARVAGQHTVLGSHDLNLDTRFGAPELRDPARRESSEASDRFSLACVLWSLWTGESPYADTLRAGHEEPRHGSDVPDRVRQVLEPLLAADAVDRASTTDDILGALREASGASQVGSTAAPPRAPLEYVAGDVINDRYQVVSKLGQGAFSTVYRVHDLHPRRDVVLKVLASQFNLDHVRRELVALESVRHANIVHVIDTGSIDTTPKQWFIKSEIAPGRPLQSILKEQAPFTPQRVIAIGTQLLAALCAIHPNASQLQELHAGNDPAAGTNRCFVHRDIKPANILITDDDHVTLLDFNIAVEAGDTQYTLSGTPEYQSPDSRHGRWEVDVDLFATAVILYELACGQHPYESRSPWSGRLIRARSVDPGLDEAFADFLDRGCSSERSKRFTSAQQMLDALRALSSPSRAPSVDGNSEGTAITGPAEAPTSEPPSGRIETMGAPTPEDLVASFLATLDSSSDSISSSPGQPARARQYTLSGYPPITIATNSKGHVIFEGALPATVADDAAAAFVEALASGYGLKANWSDDRTAVVIQANEDLFGSDPETVAYRVLALARQVVEELAEAANHPGLAAASSPAVNQAATSSPTAAELVLSAMRRNARALGFDCIVASRLSLRLTPPDGLVSIVVALVDNPASDRAPFTPIRARLEVAAPTLEDAIGVEVKRIQRRFTKRLRLVDGVAVADVAFEGGIDPDARASAVLSATQNLIDAVVAVLELRRREAFMMGLKDSLDRLPTVLTRWDESVRSDLRLEVLDSSSQHVLINVDMYEDWVGCVFQSDELSAEVVAQISSTLSEQLKAHCSWTECVCEVALWDASGTERSTASPAFDLTVVEDNAALIVSMVSLCLQDVIRLLSEHRPSASDTGNSNVRDEDDTDERAELVRSKRGEFVEELMLLLMTPFDFQTTLVGSDPPSECRITVQAFDEIGLRIHVDVTPRWIGMTFEVAESSINQLPVLREAAFKAFRARSVTRSSSVEIRLWDSYEIGVSRISGVFDLTAGHEASGAASKTADLIRRLMTEFEQTSSSAPQEQPDGQEEPEPPPAPIRGSSTISGSLTWRLLLGRKRFKRREFPTIITAPEMVKASWWWDTDTIPARRWQRFVAILVSSVGAAIGAGFVFFLAPLANSLGPWSDNSWVTILCIIIGGLIFVVVGGAFSLVRTGPWVDRWWPRMYQGRSFAIFAIIYVVLWSAASWEAFDRAFAPGGGEIPTSIVKLFFVGIASLTSLILAWCSSGGAETNDRPLIES